MTPGTVRPTSVRYMGFVSSDEGREYTLRVDGNGEPRIFVFVIPHAAFAAREARFQDAPDLCFAKLQREIAGGNALESGARFVITSADLTEYRESQARRSPEKKRAPPPPDPEKT